MNRPGVKSASGQTAEQLMRETHVSKSATSTPVALPWPSCLSLVCMRLIYARADPGVAVGTAAGPAATASAGCE